MLQADTRPASRQGMQVSNDTNIMTDNALSTDAVPGMAGMPTGMLDDFGMDYGQANYEVFDPFNWMLDGLVDFPYTFNGAPGMDQSGLDTLGNGM